MGIPTQAEDSETNCRVEETHVRHLTEKPEINRRPEERWDDRQFPPQMHGHGFL